MIIKLSLMNFQRIGLLCLVGMVSGVGLYGQIKAVKPFGKVSALIVGIAEYQNEKIPDLEFAHRDAEAFAHYLQYETAWKVAPEDIVLLTNASATYGKFINELQALVENSQPNDRLILYFSGHGDIEKVEEDFMGYLLFYDASPTTYASGGACMVNTLNEYVEKLVLEKETEVILISDACRSGSLAGSSAGGPQATTAALSELFSHTTKLLSCESDQQSIEGPQWGEGRGVFSYYLVKGLKGLADSDQNHYVDLFELERYVQDSVRSASNRKQLPVVKGLSSTRLARVDRQVLEQVPVKVKPSGQELVAVAGNSRSGGQDTSFLPQLALFETALSEKHLLYPEKGSANAIYESLADFPAAQPIRKVMKISLATALQDEAQQAMNEYIVSPGKELARRWSDAEVYAYYPDYLGRAAELLGPENYFYDDIKSRELYFKGVNLRLQYDADAKQTELLQQALAVQQQALVLQPIAPHIYNELGLLYKRMDQATQAISAFQQALSYSPKWSLALTNLALVYRELEQYALAEKMYQDAIQLDTNFALSHYNLSVLYEEMDRMELAKAELLKTIQCDPQFAEAYYNLANLSLGDPLAESYLLKYIQLQPEDPDGFNLLGYIYHSSGQYAKAQQAYQSSLTIDPDSYYTRNSLSYVYRKMENYPAAKGLWEKYLTRKPDDPNAYFKYAGILALNKEPTAALTALRTALTKGFKAYDELQAEPNLDSLKQLAEYQALLQEFFPKRE